MILFERVVFLNVLYTFDNTLYCIACYNNLSYKGCRIGELHSHIFLSSCQESGNKKCDPKGGISLSYISLYERLISSY